MRWNTTVDLTSALSTSFFTALSTPILEKTKFKRLNDNTAYLWIEFGSEPEKGWSLRNTSHRFITVRKKSEEMELEQCGNREAKEEIKQ